jgi:hypothetical protein
VAPSAAFSVAPNQTLAYNARVGSTFTSAAPLFSNYIGNLTYASTTYPTGTTFAAATGIVSGTPTVAVVNKAVSVVATDEFGRTSTFSYTVNVAAALSITYGGVKQLYTNVNYVASTAVPAYALAVPAVTGKVGNLTYETTNLPDGMSFASGKLLGHPTLPGDIGIGISYAAVLKVVDDYDGATATVTVPFLLDSPSHKYWRVWVYSTSYGTYDINHDFYFANMNELYAYNQANARIMWTNAAHPNLTDNSTGTSEKIYVNTNLDFVLPAKDVVNKLGQSSGQYQMRIVRLYYSDDGSAYKQYWYGDMSSVTGWADQYATRQP